MFISQNQTCTTLVYDNNAEKFSDKPIKNSERLLDFDKYVLSEEFDCHFPGMEDLFSFRFDFYGYLYYLLILMGNSVNGNQWNIWNSSFHLLLHCPDAIILKKQRIVPSFMMEEVATVDFLL